MKTPVHFSFVSQRTNHLHMRTINVRVLSYVAFEIAINTLGGPIARSIQYCTAS